MFDINEMTPLEYARYKASLPEPENCVDCANCVKVGGAYYCEVTGKLLMERFMNIGRCMGVPSRFKTKNKEQTMDELVRRYNSYINGVNKIGEYIKCIADLPPKGTGAKKEIKLEIDVLFTILAGAEKALKSALLEVVDDE